MTHLWPDDQPVAVTLDASGLPLAFTWQGRLHRRLRTVQSWDMELEWWRPSGPLHHTYVALLTTGKLFCVLCHDHTTGAWLLVRLYD